MESLIEAFLSIGYGSGSGSGYGSGYGFGYGSGSGSGYGFGSGSGDGSGYGFGSGSGYGFGSGSGDGSGYGFGSGSGYGFGSGSGSGSGSGVKAFCGQNVYVIDNTLTLIDHVKNNVAKGHILSADLTVQPCFIVKQNNVFAHGRTIHEAVEAVRTKLYNIMSTDDRIAEFIKTYPTISICVQNTELFEWHGRLTGSCQQGRESFARNHEIDIINGSMTIADFISLTENADGGKIIKQLKEAYIKGG